MLPCIHGLEERWEMDATERERLTRLLADEKVAVLVTQGEEYPTATMQAFAETPELEILFIMNEGSYKYTNLQARPKVAVMVDTRDTGDIPTFKVSRAVIDGQASEIPRGGAEWTKYEELFLKKAPFEAPFFTHPTLRMIKITPRRVSYAGADRVSFKAEF
jgi:nitroimidazol reductase NimA-like FMN-containing flavoprotein (pyridoxamine 5'-phosphate oxidase superfamily)